MPNCYDIWVSTNTAQWANSDSAQWEECSGEVLNQIWTDEHYVYSASDFGLEVIDLVTEMKIAYIDYSGGFNSVWANYERIYLATTNSGIKYLDKTCISGSIMAPYDLEVCLSDYLTPYGITSNNVRYIHGNDDRIMCCTTSGVDVLSSDYRSYTVSTEANKCFLTNTYGYYTTYSGVNKIRSLADWPAPDKVYSAGGGVIAVGAVVRDIYVSNAVLCIATSSGVYVIDENDDYDLYYDVDSFNIVAVWADENSARAQGKLYLSTANAFTIIDLATKTVYDRYTQTIKGRGNETLSANDIVDINVGP